MKRFALFALLAAAPACLTSTRGYNGSDPDVLTHEALVQAHFDNAYDAVSALKAMWLQPRGPDSFSSPSVVLVYVDNAKLGGIETLRSVPMGSIAAIRHFDANQATARWGVGHGAGVIFIESVLPPKSPDVRPTARIDRSTLTGDEIHGEHFETAYDVIEAKRSNWLLDLGPMTMDSTHKVAVQVYFDNVRLGRVEALRQIPVKTISTIHHLDGLEAQARYGIGHGAGVIQLESWARGSTPDGPTDLAVNQVIEGSESQSADGFVLAGNGRAATIVVSSHDYPGAVRAARDLGADIGKVTGSAPAITLDSMPRGHSVILIGTLGRSPLIDRLVANGKLSPVNVMGRWESYVRQVVPNPAPGVEEALVIAGSDKRGTIYGAYDLSSLVGVSPWDWWADVTPQHRDELRVARARITQGEPAVKYRGIFINDEAPAFSGWTRERFGGVNHQVYERMFELILRMKGNYLWPAMWGNAFADDDSLNARLADEYGIVMGTSHHEPMTRAQQEWKRYGSGEWDYGKNDSTLRAFWRAGIVRMRNNGAPRENIVTVGMRGDGDRPMTTNGESNVALLEHVVADQRKIIADVTGRPASATPQLWALYKEVQDYYDKGMRVPDDVTLLFADDNWGNIRRLPQSAERNRPGGFGVYYHFDYVGGPRNYKWLNTNPISRVWEQMHLASEYGADRIWIVNVGDLKPMEFPVQFFLDYAWNPAAWSADRLPQYTQKWAAQQFGEAHAGEIAGVITRTLKYAGRRKPELLAPETYSLANYREAETVSAEYAALRADAEGLAASIPPSLKDAYYELVLHPVLAAANLNELYRTVAMNRRAAAEQRSSTNDLAEQARRLFDNDAAIAHAYNAEIAGGKWSHMMDQTHIGYTYWQEPPRNLMPRVDVIEVPAGSEMGLAFEGQQMPMPFAPGGGRGGFRPPAFPEFDPFARQAYYIDLYNKRTIPFAYTIDAPQSWLRVSAPAGTVSKEARVLVSVDWTHAPVGRTTIPVTVHGAGDSRFVIQATVNNPASPRREDVDGFVESNGYVSMEAEHYARAVATAPLAWVRIPDLGRTLSGMTSAPVTMTPRTPGGASPQLEYRLFMFDSGAVAVRAYLSPTLNFTGASTGLRYAVSFDDEAPQVVNIVADTSLKAWEQSVSDNVSIRSTTHTLARAGAHVLRFWMVDPGVVLQKLVVDAGGLKPSYLGPPESFRGRKAVSGR